MLVAVYKRLRQAAIRNYPRIAVLSFILTFSTLAFKKEKLSVGV